MPAQPVIQTHELTKEFRHPFFTWLIRARALTNLTLSVNQGEVFGLLGPNGSGKSTTIKLMLGLIFPTRGQVSMFGKRPSDNSIKSKIGFLPEESYLYRFLDAEETLDFYARLFNLPAAERARRIDSLLDMVGLQRERRRPVAEFSKGMQRRIGIAQALINDPDLVILDEPTTGLDPLGTREVKDLILQLKEKGKTVLLSSHLLSDVEDVCDRIAILYGGKVQAEGPVQSVLQKQKLTQITAEMDDDTVKEVTELIRKRQGADLAIKVQPPLERLEQFFLRVVHEAQEQQLDTSGVSGATGKLDFLTSAEERENLLQKLVKGDDEDQGKTKVAASPEVKAVRLDDGESKNLLNKLVKSGKDNAEPESKSESLIEKPKPEADRSILDKLTSGDD